MFQEFLRQLSGDAPVDPMLRLALIAVILLLTWAGQRMARWLVVRLVEGSWRALTRVRHLEIQLETTLSQALARPIQVLIVVLGVRLAIALADLSATLAGIADQMTVSLTTLAIFWLLYRIVNVIAQFYVARAALEVSPLDETIVRFARQIAIFLIFVFAAVLILQQWGQDVGGLVAGLGVASLAVALAAQDALSNFIAYFAIVADAPFKVGDFIVIDDLVKGKVQEISFRSTRIRTLENSMMVIPNHSIANANVINWARTRKRRLDMIVGITYGSTPEQIEALVRDTKNMLQAHDQVTTDRMVVDFVEFGESSLNLRLSFLVKSTTWEDLEAVKTDVNLRLMRILRDNGLSIAFPTRTVFLDHAALPQAEVAEQS
jgi:MscS family membrane protein